MGASSVYPAALKQLERAIATRDAPAQSAALAHITQLDLPRAPAQLLRLHERLLFLLAHPADAAQRRQTEALLKRLAAHLKAWRREAGTLPVALENEGLPHADTVTRFSHDGLRALLDEPSVTVALDGLREPRMDMGDVLSVTLPAIERAETTAGLEGVALLDALGVKPKARLAFLVDQLARLDATPLAKDRLFDALDLFVRLTPRDARFCKAAWRLPMPDAFFQSDWVKRFDAGALMDTPLPPPRPLDDAARQEVVRTIRGCLAMYARETDPATYLEPRDLWVFDLERGLTVALYGMTADRQLPLESYIGLMLFKNGLPVSYGGAWLLGPRAAFGMNIFKPYRGGESAVMMCQLLRAYRQLFGVRYFEVDATQFGLDNPDGIASGAYWFYYRHGFRSLDGELAALAEAEQARMRRDPTHRSSAATLTRLTGSGVALNFGGPRPPHVYEWGSAVTRWINRVHGGLRSRAEAAAIAQFLQAAPMAQPRGAASQRVLADVALLAAAMCITHPRPLKLLSEMVRSKPRNTLAYQSQMRQFIDCV